MGIYKSISGAVSSTYTNIDRSLGGILPGGASTPAPAKPAPTSTPAPQMTKAPTSTPAPTQSRASGGGGGGGSGGGGSSSQPSTLQTALAPYQQIPLKPQTPTQPSQSFSIAPQSRADVAGGSALVNSQTGQIIGSTTPSVYFAGTPTIAATPSKNLTSPLSKYQTFDLGGQTINTGGLNYQQPSRKDQLQTFFFGQGATTKEQEFYGRKESKLKSDIGLFTFGQNVLEEDLGSFNRLYGGRKDLTSEEYNFAKRDELNLNLRIADWKSRGSELNRKYTELYPLSITSIGLVEPFGSRKGLKGMSKDFGQAFKTGGLFGAIALPFGKVSENLFVKPGEKVGQFFNIEKEQGAALAMLPYEFTVKPIVETGGLFSPRNIVPTKEFYKEQNLPTSLAYVGPGIALGSVALSVGSLGYGAIESAAGRGALKTAREIKLTTFPNTINQGKKALRADLGEGISIDFFSAGGKSKGVTVQQFGTNLQRLQGENLVQGLGGKIDTVIEYQSPITGKFRRIASEEDILKIKWKLTEETKLGEGYYPQQPLAETGGFTGTPYTRQTKQIFSKETIFGNVKTDVTTFNYKELVSEGKPFANIVRHPSVAGIARTNQEGDIISFASGKVSKRSYEFTGEYKPLEFKSVGSEGYFKPISKKIYKSDVGFTPEEFGQIKVIKINMGEDLGVLGRGRGRDSTFKDLYGQQQLAPPIQNMKPFPSVFTGMGKNTMASMTVKPLGYGYPSYTGGLGQVNLASMKTAQPIISSSDYSFERYGKGDLAPVQVLSLVNERDLYKNTFLPARLDLFGVTKTDVSFKPALTFGTPQALSSPQAFKYNQQFSFATPQLEKYGVATPKEPFGSFDFNFRTPPFKSFAIPFLPFGVGQDRIPRRKIRGGRTYQRAPSFAALNLGYKAQKKAFGEFTGLVERPILTRSKRRRR